MGRFDTIFLEVSCPYCGEPCKDGQTKDLGRAFSDYGLGDILPFFRTLETISVLYQCYDCKAFFRIKVKIEKSQLTIYFEYTDLDYAKMPFTNKNFNPSKRF